MVPAARRNGFFRCSPLFIAEIFISPLLWWFSGRISGAFSVS
jgi:hypothetical protein